MQSLKMLPSLSCLVALPALASNAQVMGGGGYAYGSSKQKAQQMEASLAMKALRSGNGIVLDASVLMNLKSQEGLAVFAVQQEAPSVAEARKKMREKQANFIKQLSALGISEKDIDIDFISQTRQYAFEQKSNRYTEFVKGYLIKENVAIRLKGKAMLAKILDVAADNEIFDLIKYDEILLKQEEVQAQLRAKAAQLLKEKAASLQKLLGTAKIKPQIVLLNSFNTLFPGDFYSSYDSNEGDQVFPGRGDITIERLARPRTFHYEPVRGGDYDLVINPSILSPAIQTTFHLSVRFELDKNVAKVTPANKKK